MNQEDSLILQKTSNSCERRLVNSSALLIPIFLLAIAQYSGQRSNAAAAVSQVGLIERNRPSVYAMFDGEEVTNENCSSKKQTAYRLRLINNTNRPINVQGNWDSDTLTKSLKLENGKSVTTLPRGTLVQMCYQVESVLMMTNDYSGNTISTDIPKENPVPDLVATCRCVFSELQAKRYNSPGAWIPPGSNIVFYIPTQYLAAGLRIYTLYNYDWEFDDAGLKANEPHHQVYFYDRDVPRKR